MITNNLFISKGDLIIFNSNKCNLIKDKNNEGFITNKTILILLHNKTNGILLKIKILINSILELKSSKILEITLMTMKIIS